MGTGMSRKFSDFMADSRRPFSAFVIKQEVLNSRYYRAGSSLLLSLTLHSFSTALEQSG